MITYNPKASTLDYLQAYPEANNQEFNLFIDPFTSDEEELTEDDKQHFQKLNKYMIADHIFNVDNYFDMEKLHFVALCGPEVDGVYQPVKLNSSLYHLDLKTIALNKNEAMRKKYYRYKLLSPTIKPAILSKWWVGSREVIENYSDLSKEEKPFYRENLNDHAFYLAVKDCETKFYYFDYPNQLKQNYSDVTDEIIQFLIKLEK